MSGAILITSVYKIKAFFKAKEDEECLDTKALYRHAVAFGLFLITDVAYYVMWPIYTLNYKNQKFFNWYISVIIFWLIGSFVSQILLCTIYWDLGTEDAEEPAPQTRPE